MTVIAQCIQRADCLEWDIIVVNKGEVPFDITMGLHNYFDVSSLKNVVISGPFSGASTLDRNANTEGTASRFESAHKTAFFNFKRFCYFFSIYVHTIPSCPLPISFRALRYNTFCPSHMHTLFPTLESLSLSLSLSLSITHTHTNIYIFMTLTHSHTHTFYLSLTHTLSPNLALVMTSQWLPPWICFTVESKALSLSLTLARELKPLSSKRVSLIPVCGVLTAMTRWWVGLIINIDWYSLSANYIIILDWFNLPVSTTRVFTILIVESKLFNTWFYISCFYCSSISVFIAAVLNIEIVKKISK